MLSNNQLLQSRGAGFANIDTTQPPIFPIENHGCPKAFHLGRPADHDLIRKPRDSFASETAIQQLLTRGCPPKNQYCQFLPPPPHWYTGAISDQNWVLIYRCTSFASSASSDQSNCRRYRRQFCADQSRGSRSEEHTSELQSLR